MMDKFGMDYRKESKQFYRGSITDSDGSHIVWFAAEDINTGLKTHKLNLHMDGTFAVVPKIAAQLFVISAQIQGMVCIPLEVVK